MVSTVAPRIKNFIPIRLARKQFHVQSPHVQKFFQHIRNVSVGSTLFRRGDDGDFQHAVPLADDGRLLGAGLRTYGNSGTVRMQLNRNCHAALARSGTMPQMQSKMPRIFSTSEMEISVRSITKVFSRRRINRQLPPSVTAP